MKVRFHSASVVRRL